jgi:hypothetical protein
MRTLILLETLLLYARHAAPACSVRQHARCALLCQCHQGSITQIHGLGGIHQLARKISKVIVPRCLVWRALLPVATCLFVALSHRYERKVQTTGSIHACYSKPLRFPMRGTPKTTLPVCYLSSIVVTVEKKLVAPQATCLCHDFNIARSYCTFAPFCNALQTDDYASFNHRNPVFQIYCSRQFPLLGLRA